MKLTDAVIKNYRSIRFAQIEFIPQCLVLVGINEAGKSSILKGLSTLGEYLPSRDEIREAPPDDEPVMQSSIEFRFSLEKTDIEAVFDEVQKTIRADADSIVASRSGQLYSFKEFVAARARGLYQVDVTEQKKFGQYWKLESNWKLADGWRKVSDTCPVGFVLSNGVTVAAGDLVSAKDCSELPEEYLAPAQMEDFARKVGTEVCRYIVRHLPKVVHWQYSEANLLPGSISISEFSADPNVCIPLKNMFKLAGHADVAVAMASIASLGRNGVINFFNRVAQSTTKHFRNVWKEHKAISFELRPDGDQLIPGVREENLYNFSARSDGFKRFVSFLLTVSATVKNGDLSNCLLLVDEPDNSLHPSGARFLRDELIKISDSNTVVYSTHSVFMIDREKLERHLIISKTKEQTQISVANDENMFKEEVLFNALGTSVFDSLREKNLIFEGWKDKKLFETAMSRVPATHSAIKASFKDVGLCYGRGAKNIKSITPLLELARRECVIITDGDSPAKEKQAEHSEVNGYGLWLRYDELWPGAPSDVTGEDFIKPSAFHAPIEDLRSRYPALPAFVEDASKSSGRLKLIDRWLAPVITDRDVRKTEIKKIKDRIFENLRSAEIESDYYDYLKALAVRI